MASLANSRYCRSGYRSYHLDAQVKESFPRPQQGQQSAIIEERTKGAKRAQKKQCSLRSLRAPFMR